MHSNTVSLFKEDNHRVADVQADVAPIIVRYGVAALLNYEAVPVALVPPIKLFLNLPGDIAEVTLIMIFEGFQTGDNCGLLLICGHVGPLDQHFPIGVRPKRIQSLLVVAGDHRDSIAVTLGDAEGLNPSWRYVHHLYLQ